MDICHLNSRKPLLFRLLRIRHLILVTKTHYRPIALVTACSKFLNSAFCPSLKITYFTYYTHDHRFGFKKQHATDMCIYTVKSVLVKTVLYIHVSLMHPKLLTELVTGLFLRN